MGVIARVDRVLLEQHGHLFPWAPVCLALGIGGYFLMRNEPSVAVIAAVIGVSVVLAALALWRPGGIAALAWALALTGFGFGLASWRAHDVAAPVLGWRYYGPVEGRVVAIDRSASDALRLTLDQVILRDLEPAQTPDRVRVSLHGSSETGFLPGQRVMTTAHLSPPQGPVEPGGFDFRRHAWFKKLGAIGYTRVPVLTVSPPQDGLWLLSLRMAISKRVRAMLPGDVGGVAAAITTGDRSGVSKQTLQTLRDSNLAHLLAISGLHMGLLSGVVFAAFRMGLALIPPLALRWPVRKLAAAGGMAAATGYLLLSGGNVATERAYIMTCVVLFAVVLDRRALSVRAVAVAAMIVLFLRPEALLSPGFQMSFAATTALVAVFGVLRKHRDKLPKFVSGPVAGVFLSSTIAGFATAPVGAAHFNSLSHFGLLANLVSVPVMGIAVVPAAVIAAVLSLVGAEGIGLQIMGLGLRWILWVASEVAALPGAVGQIKAPGPWVLPLLSLGALWVILWQSRNRLFGLVPMVVAVGLWHQTIRPPVLIAESAGLVGVMMEQGRALSKPKGAGFIADVWLENDGDGADQSQAAMRWPRDNGQTRKISLGSQELIHITGKRAAKMITGCDKGQIIVSSVDLPFDGPCQVLDPKRLRLTGAMAFDPKTRVWTQSQTGRRLWSQ